MNSPYLAGNNFTLADVACAPNFAQLKRMGLDITKFPKLDEYLDRMEVRPAQCITAVHMVEWQ